MKITCNFPLMEMPNLNSTMVRLLLKEMEYAKTIMMVSQFHDGSIIIIVGWLSLFLSYSISIPRWFDYYIRDTILWVYGQGSQFHDGSIIIIVKVGKNIGYMKSLNSTMVRLLYELFGFWRNAWGFVSIPRWFDYYRLRRKELQE